MNEIAISRLRAFPPAAAFELASIYEFGKGGLQIDVDEATNWWASAAHGNDAEAQFRLAEAFLSGRGVEQSKQKAIRWYAKAAAQGHAGAARMVAALTKDL